MLADWMDTIVVETMGLVMAAWRDWKRVAEKAASMVELTVLLMVGE